MRTITSREILGWGPAMRSVPNTNAGAGTDYWDGFIGQTTGMICFLTLHRMFEGLDAVPMIAA